MPKPKLAYDWSNDRHMPFAFSFTHHCSTFHFFIDNRLLRPISLSLLLSLRGCLNVEQMDAVAAVGGRGERVASLP